MNLKKYLIRAGIATGTVGVIVAGAAAFSAFEAHVINVTATIENALTVPIEAEGLSYGTVFPQEELDLPFDVRLSGSFLEQTRVDTVDYVIRQKPKCVLVEDVDLPQFGLVTEDEQGTFACEDEENYDILPLLCPYLSKHETTGDPQNVPGDPGDNDSQGINAFHGLPGLWNLATTLATQVAGQLWSTVGDVGDTWNIDLRVPCFAGDLDQGGFVDQCAQDWDDFVIRESGDPQINPDDYVLDPDLEHEIFGCDLWLEVTDISNQVEPE